MRCLEKYEYRGTQAGNRARTLTRDASQWYDTEKPTMDATPRPNTAHAVLGSIPSAGKTHPGRSVSRCDKTGSGTTHRWPTCP